MSEAAGNKKSVWKKLWHKAPALNAQAYKIQFQKQGEKVDYEMFYSYPICLLGCKFRPPTL